MEATHSKNASSLEDFDNAVQDCYAQLNSQKNPTSTQVNDLYRKLKKLLKVIFSTEDEIDIFIGDCLKYIETVLTFISNFGSVELTKQKVSLEKYLGILPRIISGTKFRNQFIINATEKVFQLFLYYRFDFAATEGLLAFYNEIASTSRQDVCKETGKTLIHFVYQLVDSLTLFGDYVVQSYIIETVFNLFGSYIRNSELPYPLFPTDIELDIVLKSVDCPTLNDEKLRLWLNKFNIRNPKIKSLECKAILVGNHCCLPPKKCDTLWVDFNIEDKIMSFYCNSLDQIKPNRIYVISKFVKKVYINRQLGKKETMLILKLSKPCVTNTDQPYWSQLDQQIKITITNQEQNISILIRGILPVVFGEAFSHVSPKISYPLKEVYKPLGIRQCRMSTGSRKPSVVLFKSNKKFSAPVNGADLKSSKTSDPNVVSFNSNIKISKSRAEYVTSPVSVGITELVCSDSNDANSFQDDEIFRSSDGSYSKKHIIQDKSVSSSYKANLDAFSEKNQEDFFETARENFSEEFDETENIVTKLDLLKQFDQCHETKVQQKEYVRLNQTSENDNISTEVIVQTNEDVYNRREELTDEITVVNEKADKSVASVDEQIDQCHKDIVFLSKEKSMSVAKMKENDHNQTNIIFESKLHSVLERDSDNLAIINSIAQEVSPATQQSSSLLENIKYQSLDDLEVIVETNQSEPKASKYFKKVTQNENKGIHPIVENNPESGHKIYNLRLFKDFKGNQNNISGLNEKEDHVDSTKQLQEETQSLRLLDKPRESKRLAKEKIQSYLVDNCDALPVISNDNANSNSQGTYTNDKEYELTNDKKCVRNLFSYNQQGMKSEMGDEIRCVGDDGSKSHHPTSHQKMNITYFESPTTILNQPSDSHIVIATKAQIHSIVIIRPNTENRSQEVNSNEGSKKNDELSHEECVKKGSSDDMQKKVIEDHQFVDEIEVSKIPLISADEIPNDVTITNQHLNVSMDMNAENCGDQDVLTDSHLIVNKEAFSDEMLQQISSSSSSQRINEDAKVLSEKAVQSNENILSVENNVINSEENTGSLNNAQGNINDANGANNTVFDSNDIQQAEGKNIDDGNNAINSEESTVCLNNEQRNINDADDANTTISDNIDIKEAKGKNIDDENQKKNDVFDENENLDRAFDDLTTNGKRKTPTQGAPQKKKKILYDPSDISYLETINLSEDMCNLNPKMVKNSKGKKRDRKSNQVKGVIKPVNKYKKKGNVPQFKKDVSFKPRNMSWTQLLDYSKHISRDSSLGFEETTQIGCRANDSFEKSDTSNSSSPKLVSELVRSKSNTSESDLPELEIEPSNVTNTALKEKLHILQEIIIPPQLDTTTQLVDVPVIEPQLHHEKTDYVATAEKLLQVTIRYLNHSIDSVTDAKVQALFKN